VNVRRIAVGLVALACALTLLACSDDSDEPEQPRDPVVLKRGNAEEPAVALLFEVRAGDTTPGAVNEILPVLREARIRAAFALTGRWAEANPDLAEAIAADGHLIVNAGYDGTSFTGQSTGQRSLTADQRSLQLSRTETSIYRITNRTTRPFFRPPLGDMDTSVERDAAAAGYPVIVAGSLDARQAVDTPGVLVRTTTATPGDIIVLSASGPSPTAQALDNVLQELENAGLSITTLDAMLETA
jgi:peptidoglycan/xylan/chitin deacetylase (PgdA/CDA1 family)